MSKVINNIVREARTGAELSAEQKSIINEAKAGGADSKTIAAMTAQAKMDNLTQANQLFSNLFKKMGESASAVIANIR